MEGRIPVNQDIAYPAPSASLILFDGKGGPTPKVLMGKRNRGMRFMPRVYVFPGGGVSKADIAAPVSVDEKPDALTHALDGVAFGTYLSAALRETEEETGLRRYRQSSLPLPLGVAVTPEESPIRFRTLFFLASLEDFTGTLRSNDEFVHLAWLDLEEAISLDLMDVTEFFLRHAMETWKNRQSGTNAALSGYPLFTYRNDRAVISYLENHPFSGA